MWTAQTAAVVLAFAGAAAAQCSAPTDELVGFASGTTGGGSGSGTTVTSCSEFQTAAEAGGVITVSGTISDCDIVDLVSDTTLIGEGADSGFTNSGVRVRQETNVIIRNLNFNLAPEGADQIDIDESTYVWVDHCAFANEGLTGDKDYYDGLLDAKHGADFLTFSWNIFADHWKGSLVGHSGSNSDEDSGHLQVTYHHNLWNNVNSRTPSLRFGTGHVYSSCFQDVPTSGINSREGAQVLVESNSFTNVVLAITTDLDSDIQGFATDLNNIYTDSDINVTQEGSWTPSYAYTVDAAETICDCLAGSAGPGNI